MTKTFTIDNTEYTVTTCTAIAVTAGDTVRQDALLVDSVTEVGETFREVVFGWQFGWLETVDDFVRMCDDDSSWSYDGDDLETVEVC